MPAALARAAWAFHAASEARFVGNADGRLAAEPLREQGSAMLRTVTGADALLALGPRDHYADGELVEAVPLALLD